VRFPDVPLASYEIHATAGGVRSGADQRSSSSLASGSAPVVLRMPPPPESPAFPVSGRVLDAGGEGISAALLKLRVNELGGEELAAISEASGEFRFDAVPPGRYLLKATRRGFPEALHEAVLDVESAGIEGVVVNVPVAGTIRGRVAGLLESGARGLRINATSTGPLPAGVRQAISGTGWVGANGEFRITGLAPGRWRVTAKVSGGRAAETTVSIERPGQEVEAILEFPPAFTLTGRVLWRGRPVEWAYVAVGQSATTDDRGHFTIRELKADRYGVSVSLGGTMFRTGQSVDLDGDDFVEIQIRGGTVTGQLLDADSGEPVAGAYIRTNALGDHGWYTWIDRTDRTGRFRLRPLAAGRWQLEIMAQGYARRRPVIEVGNEDIDGVRIELQPSVGLRLRFQAAASTVAGDLSLTWQDLATGDVLGTWTRAGTSRQRSEDPGFVWEEIALGRGVLTVASDKTLLASRFVVNNAGEPVRVLLHDAGRLRLTVAALDDDPAIPATLRLYDENGLEVAWHGKTRFDRTKYGERAGQFTIMALPAGTLRAEVTADDGRSWSQQIEIYPREWTRVVLR
jgi:protocatechuate 3,4-dioxygenase beta subunit